MEMDSEDDNMYDLNVEEEEDGGEPEEEDGGEQQEQNCTILNEEDISERMEEDITTISVFTGSRESASILLRHYNWIVSKVNDAWFGDEEKVRRETGLLELDQIPANDVKKKKKLSCGICFDSYPPHMMNAAAACGHPFCNSCWTGYITTSINDGPNCLYLRCPDPSCHAAVRPHMIELLASEEDKHKYERYLLRSYVENSRKTKWCPAPGCNYIVEFHVGSDNYDVSCECTNNFCWKCTEEPHRPVDCSTVAKWILKNQDESENTNWILANSKPCPKCNRPIEKNNGCMHMTCSAPCQFQFCWLCLGAWSGHRGACNGYLKSNKALGYDETENKREMAKRSIQRYTHYYERWVTNQKSRQKAVADLQQMQSVHIKKLKENLKSLPESQFQFITEAWLQIIECRRMLKWTYAYGFYLPEEEHAKRNFFEYLQGEAEVGLERLHQCAEKELQEHLNSEGFTEFRFIEFRTKLVGLTNVTRNYFENLVQAMENGLIDIDSQVGACSKSGSSKNLGGTNRKGGKGKGTNIFRSSVPEDYDYQWLCEHCTYANKDMTTTDCQMCQLPRYY